MMSRMIDDEETLKDNGLIEINGCNVLEERKLLIHTDKYSIGEDGLIDNTIPLTDICYDLALQLQQLKAENEQLKAFKRECLKPVCFPDIEPEVINKYKQALEEVRDCINVLSTVDNDFKGSMVEWKINKIINEVLKSENHKQADS